MSDQTFHNLAEPLLVKTITLTIELSEVLEKEKVVLESTDTSSLESIAGKKELIMTALDKHNQDWLALAEQQIKELSAEGIDQFLKHYDSKFSTKLFNAWKELQAHARQCQRLNTINGTILTLRNQAANQMLAILRGQTVEEDVYNTDGHQKPATGGGHSLAKV